ncbi:MAG: hypothetical protein WAU11_07040 [Ignavibacteriaceae bacterium]
MKKLFIIFLLLQLSIFISCSNCKHSTKNVEQVNIHQDNNPTSIVQNLSIVTARIDEVLFNDETDYQLKVTVLVVEEMSDKKVSIATPGQEYLLTPNFRYDGDMIMDSDVNNDLKKLSKISKGKEFKAEISLENQKGWFIQKVLSK